MRSGRGQGMHLQFGGALSEAVTARAYRRFVLATTILGRVISHLA